MKKKPEPTVQPAVADAEALETAVLTTGSIQSDGRETDAQQLPAVTEAADAYTDPNTEPNAVPLHKLTTRDGYPRIIAEEPDTAGLKSAEELESMEAELLEIARDRPTNAGSELVDPSASLKRAKRQTSNVLETIEQSSTASEQSE